jgi:CRP/FNR family transcriptional regulator, cyclic AMP receptor protein
VKGLVLYSKGRTSFPNDGMGTKEGVIERRRSVPPSCSTCVSRQACALSRSLWFQSIKTVRYYSRHVTLIRQGDPGKHIHVLRRGWLQIAHIMPNGKSIVDLWGPGSIIGIAPAITNGAYPFSAIALEECEIEQADAAEFLKHLKKDANIAFDLLRHMSRLTTRLLDHLYVAAGKVRTEERLLRALIEISLTCGVRADGGVRLNLPLPVQVIADWIGCSRQWASKLLRDLEARGAMKRRNGWITLTGLDEKHQ